MSKLIGRPKQTIHAKQRRQQRRYFGQLTSDDLPRHRRKLTTLLREQHFITPALPTLARSVARHIPATPTPFNSPPPDMLLHRKVIEGFLADPQNARRRDKHKLGKKAASHQRAIALLHDLLGGKLLDADDSHWLRARFAEKDPELAAAIDAVSRTATGTSGHLNGSTQGHGTLKVEGVPPAKQRTRRQITLSTAVGGGNACGSKRSRNLAGGGAPCGTINARGGGVSAHRRRIGRSAFRGAWPGAGAWPITASASISPNHLFRPGNETVVVGCGDDPWGELHTRGGSVSKGTFANGSMAIGGGDALAHSQVGIQSPGADEIRVGPRELVEISHGPSSALVNTAQNQPWYAAQPCECMTCTGFMWKWRNRWWGNDFSTYCEALQLHREARRRGRTWKRWLPWKPAGTYSKHI